mmetsp:Transcript_12625/g.29301  ORF Transcript_12625/g.29301 Transcript_12625/m.29301 type:complete len:130 (-) Transcript_12625:21-410(-)
MSIRSKTWCVLLLLLLLLLLLCRKKKRLHSTLTRLFISLLSAKSFMFSYATHFNQNIGNWDVGNVQNMVRMATLAMMVVCALTKPTAFLSLVVRNVFRCHPIQSRYWWMECRTCDRHGEGFLGNGGAHK